MTALYTVVFEIKETNEFLTRRVSVTEGYSTFGDIPKILETFYGRPVVILSATLN